MFQERLRSTTRVDIPKLCLVAFLLAQREARKRKGFFLATDPVISTGWLLESAGAVGALGIAYHAIPIPSRFFWPDLSAVLRAVGFALAVHLFNMYHA